MRTWFRHDPVHHRAQTTPESTALIDASTGIRRTYEDLSGAIDRCSTTLRDLLAESSRDRPTVAIAATPSPAFAVALFATWRSGAVAAPLAVDEGEHRLLTLTPELVLDPVEGTLEQWQPSCPIVSVEPTFGPVSGGEPSAEWTSDDDALVLFTSGTTGSSKGVRITPKNLVASAVGSAFRLGHEPSDRWFDCLPPNHMGGLAPLVRAPLSGAAVVLERKFDAARTIERLAKFDATGISVVPTMLRRMLERGWTPHPTLRAVLCGGAPTPPDLVREAAAASVPLFPTYGTTETASQIATARPVEAFADPATVGSPLVTADVTLVEPKGSDPVEPGTVGEVVVDGPIVSPGYLESDRRTGDYGLHTGDLARQDPAGRLEIIGRLDDAIQTGGETVHPVRVADAIRALPGIRDAAVVGLPDAEWGERVAAMVVPEADGVVTRDDLRNQLEGVLSHWERPREVATAEALPRTDSGTVDRAAVRTHFTD